MTIKALTGVLGSGKTLWAVQQASAYAYKGRPVVANFHVDLAPVQPWLDRLRKKPVPIVKRIPDRPTGEDMIALGRGGEREETAGLVILDEVGPLLNARTWSDPGRMQFIDWLLHTRKLGWDVHLIVQHLGIIDKQIRTTAVENLVRFRRLDRVKVLGISLPRIHLGIEKYGCEVNAPVARRHWFRADRYFPCYDTQAILGDFGGNAPAGSPALPDVPAGALSPPCPQPSSDLGRAMQEIAVELGLCRSILPA